MRAMPDPKVTMRVDLLRRNPERPRRAVVSPGGGQHVVLRAMEKSERVLLLSEQRGIAGFGRTLLAERWHTNPSIKG